MKKAIWALCILVSGCSSEQNMTPEVTKEFAECETVYPDKVGNYADQARCKAYSAIKSYQDKGKDASNLIAISNMQIAEWQKVDAGQITPDRAIQNIKLYDLEQRASGHRRASGLSALGVALSGMAVAGQSFQNGYNQGIANYRPPYQYQSPTSCITQPSGGGFVTSCNH